MLAASLNFTNWEKIVFYAMNQWFPFMTFMVGFWLARAIYKKNF